MASEQDPNVYAYRGRRLLSAYHARHKDTIPHLDLSKLRLGLKFPHGFTDLPVCIIGAGTAGLYTAMILESLGINYHIIDANTRERVGGRLFTYHFPGGGKYDYYVPKIHLLLRIVLTFFRTSGPCGFLTHRS